MYKICGDTGFALLRDLRPLHCYSLISLFQVLCQCGRLKKRAGNEQGLVEKEGSSPFSLTGLFFGAFKGVDAEC